MKVRTDNKLKLVQNLRKERNDPYFLKDFDLRNTMFSGYLRKVTSSARHILLVFYVIKRYIEIKAKLKADSNDKSVVPRIIFIGGQNRPGDGLHLQFIKFVSTLGHFLEKDPDTNKHLRLIFLPNYTTSKEYRFVAALDVNEQLLMPGKQGCSSQALKFAMNGSILLGSRDSTNLRISNTLGENVAVLFG